MLRSASPTTVAVDCPEEILTLLLKAPGIDIKAQAKLRLISKAFKHCVDVYHSRHLFLRFMPNGRLVVVAASPCNGELKMISTPILPGSPSRLIKPVNQPDLGFEELFALQVARYVRVEDAWVDAVTLAQALKAARALRTFELLHTDTCGTVIDLKKTTTTMLQVVLTSDKGAKCGGFVSHDCPEVRIMLLAEACICDLAKSLFRPCVKRLKLLCDNAETAIAYFEAVQNKARHPSLAVVVVYRSGVSQKREAEIRQHLQALMYVPVTMRQKVRPFVSTRDIVGDMHFADEIIESPGSLSSSEDEDDSY